MGLLEVFRQSSQLLDRQRRDDASDLVTVIARAYQAEDAQTFERSCKGASRTDVRSQSERLGHCADIECAPQRMQDRHDGEAS